MYIFFCVELNCQRRTDYRMPGRILAIVFALTVKLKQKMRTGESFHCPCITTDKKTILINGVFQLQH